MFPPEHSQGRHDPASHRHWTPGPGRWGREVRLGWKSWHTLYKENFNICINRPQYYQKSAMEPRRQLLTLGLTTGRQRVTRPCPAWAGPGQALQVLGRGPLLRRGPAAELFCYKNNAASRRGRRTGSESAALSLHVAHEGLYQLDQGFLALSAGLGRGGAALALRRGEDTSCRGAGVATTEVSGKAGEQRALGERKRL